MYLFSGRSGNLLARIDDPVPQRGASFGFQDAAPLAPGDVTGDGRADLYANGFEQNGPTGPAEGRAWVFDGKATADAGSGVVRYALSDPTPETGGQFGWSLDKTDYDKDPVPDLYVGSAPHHGGGSQKGGTYVFNGTDGAELKRLELPDGDVQPNDGSFVPFGPNLGWGLAAPGDLNADGEPDYAAGAPFMNVGGNPDQGRMYAFLSPGPSPSPSPAPGPVGGPGGSMPGAPAGGDTTPPLVTLTGPTAQSIKRKSVFVDAEADEDANLTGKGTVGVPRTARYATGDAPGRGRFDAPLAAQKKKRRKARVLRVRPATARAHARVKVRMRFVLPKRTIKAVKQVLGKGRRSTVRLTITATDPSGNSREVKRTIRLKR